MQHSGKTCATARGCSLDTSLNGDCGFVAGARHRRQHRHLQSGGRCVAEKAYRSKNQDGLVQFKWWLGAAQKFQLQCSPDGRKTGFASQHVVSATDLRAVS